MTTRILIARHGNTFLSTDTPTRIGYKTDLPLVEEQRSRNLGRYLKEKNLIPSVVFAAPLQRTMQSAQLIMAELQQSIKILPASQFVEIDYGPDENKPESEVEIRLGKLTLAKNNINIHSATAEQIQAAGKTVVAAWNTEAIVPPGWVVNVNKCRQAWLEFATMIETVYQNQNVLVVSSNGIMRFAPHLTNDFQSFTKNYNIKVATGSLSVFEKTKQDEYWSCKGWNIKPM